MILKDSEIDDFEYCSDSSIDINTVPRTATSSEGGRFIDLINSACRIFAQPRVHHLPCLCV